MRFSALKLALIPHYLSSLTAVKAAHSEKVEHGKVFPVVQVTHQAFFAFSCRAYFLAGTLATLLYFEEF